MPVTIYKVQVKCGITCYREDKIKRLIENIMTDEFNDINKEN